MMYQLKKEKKDKGKNAENISQLLYNHKGKDKHPKMK